MRLIDADELKRCLIDKMLYLDLDTIDLYDDMTLVDFTERFIDKTPTVKVSRIIIEFYYKLLFKLRNKR